MNLPILPRVLIVIFLIATLTACSGNSEADVTYVVVTSTPQGNVEASQPVGQVATVTATPIPQPTATPTPDIPVDVTLRIADTYLLNGYYERALSAYQGILTNPNATEEQRARAAFDQGRGALLGGNFQQAVTSFTLLIDSFPNSELTADGYFLRADALMGLSRWTEAINDYNQYLRLRPGIIDSYVHERIGDAYIAIEFYDQALDSYALAAESPRGIEQSFALRQKIANVYVSAGDVTSAIAQYDAILQVATDYNYRAAIEFLAARALLDVNNLELGLPRMQRIFNEYPDTTEALAAMNNLQANGRELNSYQEGRTRYFNSDYAGAIEAFNRYSTEVPLTEIPAEMYLLLGRAYREVGNSNAALVAFDTIVKQYPRDEALGDALLEQGRTRFLDGDIDGAILFYTSIADNFGYLREASAEALWRVGYLHSTRENYVESRNVFERLANAYPETESATSGLSIAAAAALNTGDVTGAEQLYVELSELATGETQADAYLQAGRLALQRNDNATAQSRFAQAVSASPDSYFAARAEDLINGVEPFKSPQRVQLEFDLATDVAEVEAWLRATFPTIEQDGALWVLSETLQSDPQLQRGTELWNLDLHDAAYEEFFDVLERNYSDVVAQWQLALYYRGLDAYLPSMQGAANIIDQSPSGGTLDAPDFLARLRYPLYYSDVLLEVTNRYELDPLLMASLIRLESLFYTYATAAAGEKGLTQVIPSTGDYIAQQLNWQDYQNTDLFRPNVSIEFGAYYLDENLDRFDGNVHAGLSAYNAGPGRAIDWMQLSGGAFDTFLSTITIASTRSYVQIAYKNYNIYRELYGADS